MIYTLTLAPAVDCHVCLEQNTIKEINKPYKQYFLPGGKGINVSKVLQVLKVDSTCLGFLGGYSGKFIKNSLDKSKIKNDFVWTKNPTRVCVKVEAGNKEIAFNPKPSPISKSEYDKLFKKIEALKSGDILIVCGAIPQDLDLNKSKTLLNKLLKKNVKFIFDTSSKLLKNACKYKPILIKPNDEELENLFDTKIHNDKDVIKLSKKLINLGAETVITSLGSNGSILVNKSEVYKASAPKGKVISTVGSGDSMVAGFVESYLKNNKPKNILAKAAACGCATAFSKGLVENRNNINKLMLKVMIK